MRIDITTLIQGKILVRASIPDQKKKMRCIPSRGVLHIDSFVAAAGDDGEGCLEDGEQKQEPDHPGKDCKVVFNVGGSSILRLYRSLARFRTWLHFVIVDGENVDDVLNGRKGSGSDNCSEQATNDSAAADDRKGNRKCSGGSDATTVPGHGEDAV